MKINVKTLVHIAQSSDNPTDLDGWLYLYNDEKRTFQKRWSVLKENLFFYYENRTAKEPLGVIILEGCQVEIVENVDEQFTFKLDFGVSQSGKDLKSYIFACETQRDLERWVKCLSCSSYEYLTTVISEMQHKLSEIKTLKTGMSMESDNQRVGSSSCPNNTVRVNPFDFEPETAEEATMITFFDLHKKYEKEIKQYLH